MLTALSTDKVLWPFLCTITGGISLMRRKVTPNIIFIPSVSLRNVYLKIHKQVKTAQHDCNCVLIQLQEDEGLVNLRNWAAYWLTHASTQGWWHWGCTESYQEMVKDREAWTAAVHGVAKSWTWLNSWTTAGTTTYEVIKPYLPLSLHVISQTHTQHLVQNSESPA